jgi:hypothetical protein
MSSLLQGCSSFTSLPVDVFRYNTAVTNMSNVLRQCNLGNLPNNLFFYNKLVTNYAFAVWLHQNIVLPPILFDLSVLNIVTSFNEFMNTAGSGFSATGTIQDVWNHALSATHSNTFKNQTALSNYASIPNNWKGL